MAVRLSRSVGHSWLQRGEEGIKSSSTKGKVSPQQHEVGFLDKELGEEKQEPGKQDDINNRRKTLFKTNSTQREPGKHQLQDPRPVS